MNLYEHLDSINIAESLSKEELEKISVQVSSGFQSDLDSRKDWEDLLEEWTKLALQVCETKTYPWPGAANVKFPLVSIAAMQFNARAYPTLVPANGKIVNCRVIGADPQGLKAARAERLSKHMSYQLMCEMDEWESEMDKLLLTLPIVGTVFKKTYYDSILNRNYSCVVFPKALVVNYWARTLEDAERKTEIIPMSPRILKQRQKAGTFLDIDLGDVQNDTALAQPTELNGREIPPQDETMPYIILEQHTFLDLDKDGIQEPYIVTFEKNTKKVLRIVARFMEEDILTNEDGEIIHIKPIEYYTKYGFVPNPEGGFYDLGFGRLLGPINKSVDTLLNQLLDAGSLSNLQAGFIGKGLRIKMGESKFNPGEWKAVNVTGDDIKKQIFPLPVREPSSVLFQLMQYLVTAGKELASVAEIFVGKMPGQNTPATTTMASIEQGMKLYTAVYKRVYKSLAKEFRKLYLLNKNYLELSDEVDILDEPIQLSDYDGPENDIVPAADPNATSAQDKQAKAQAIMQVLSLGTINPMEATMRYLEAFDIPDVEKLVMQSQPQPDPKQQEMQAKMQMEAEKLQMKMQMDKLKAQLDVASKEQELQIKQKMAELEIQHKQMLAYIEQQSTAAKHHQDMTQGMERHAASMIQQHEANQVKKEQSSKEKTKK